MPVTFVAKARTLFTSVIRRQGPEHPTDHPMLAQLRPPCPEDAVQSRTISAHNPTVEGANRDTTGTTGLVGGRRLIVTEGMVKRGLQFVTTVQSFANTPARIVTPPPYKTEDEAGYTYNSDGDCHTQTAVLELENLSKASQEKRPSKLSMTPLPRFVGESNTS